MRFLRFFITDFKVILTGDVDKLEQTKNNRCVYIQNHQTELDWLFCNYFLQMFDRESDFSAVMKGSIGYHPFYFFTRRSVPTFGYIVKDLGMCLLDRNWQSDQSHFKDFMTRFETHPRPMCAFICPEGTTITARSTSPLVSCEDTYKRSQEYAAKTNRPVFEVSTLVSINRSICFFLAPRA